MEATIWFIFACIAIIQIIMVAKFFEMTSDIKDIRNILLRITREQSTPKVESPKEAVENNRQIIDTPKDDPSKFTWQSYVAITIIVLGILLYIIAN